MRILLVTHKYHPEFGGGAASYCKDVAMLLRSSGHEVTILAASSGESRTDRVNGMEVIRIGPLDDRHFRTTYNRSVAEEMAGIIRTCSPDVIHVNSLSRFGLTPLMLTKDHEVIKVMTLHDYPMVCARNNLLDRRGRLCEGPNHYRCALCVDRRYPRHLVFSSTFRQLSSNLDIICPSEFVAKMACKEGIGRSITILNHFVPLAFHSLLEERRDEPDESPEIDTILFCGRLNRSKGASILLSLAKHLAGPTMTLEIVGPTQNMGAFSRRLALLTRSPHVRVYGFLDERELVERFRSATILVFPSMWPEVFGLVVLQGLAAGLPVVASRVGAIPEIVRPNLEGFLVEPGDGEGFVNVIMHCLNRRDHLARMSIRAQTRARRYSPQRYVDSLLKVYMSERIEG